MVCTVIDPGERGCGLNVKNKSLLSTQINMYSTVFASTFCFKFLSPDVLSSFGKNKHLNTVCSCYFTSVFEKIF